MSKKSGDFLFVLLRFGAISVLGNMTWELLGLKWPDKKPSANTVTPPDASSAGENKEK